MKQYIGTKQVKAVPMTRTEAEKLLGRNLTSKGEYGEEGYLIEYEGGYKSWSPKMAFDLTYTCCDDFKGRLKIEYDELNDRLTKLKVALDKDGFREKVGDYQFKLMTEQALGMEKYFKCLEARMEYIGIIKPDRSKICDSCE